MQNAVRLACINALLNTAVLCPVYAEEQGAEEQERVTPLEAVTVYATLSEQSTFDVPAMVSTVDTDRAGNAQASDIGDLLEFTPGVEVGSGPDRNGQTISIRGFGDSEIITLMDGRRQNFESGHDGRFFVDPSLLKSVELVKGAASAIYGGGAIGGVVAFETKDATDLLEEGRTSGVMTSLGYRSATNEFSPVITSYGRAGGWDYLGSLSHRNSGDIQQGGDHELRAENQLLSGLFKTGYSFNDFHRVEFEAQLLNSDGTEPGVEDEKETRDKQLSLKYEFVDPDNSWLAPKLHLYHNDTEIEETDQTGSDAGRVKVHKYTTLGFKADNQTELAVSDSSDHLLSYGFEIYKNEQLGTDSVSGIIDGIGGVPNAEATNYGFYLQDEIEISTAAGDFLIIPAARFDSYESEAEDGKSLKKSKISPKISLSYKPTQNVMFFGSWAQAFRAPEFAEAYATGQHYPGNNFIENPDLKPETVTTVELGLGFDFDDVLVDQDKARIKGSWFTSDGEDFISMAVDVAGGTSQFVNIPDARLTGFEVEAQYDFHPLAAKLGLSYVEAENQDTGAYLSNNVPLTLVADVGYALDSIDSLVGWRGRFAAANDKVDLDAHETPTDGYGVHDLYYRWTPDAKGLETLTVDLGIENLFDKAYTLRFADNLEEGRSYVARVTYRW